MNLHSDPVREPRMARDRRVNAAPRGLSSASRERGFGKEGLARALSRNGGMPRPGELASSVDQERTDRGGGVGGVTNTAARRNGIPGGAFRLTSAGRILTPGG